MTSGPYLYRKQKARFILRPKTSHLKATCYLQVRKFMAYLTLSSFMSETEAFSTYVWPWGTGVAGIGFIT